MIRRFAPVAGALAAATAALSLTACATFSGNDEAASVDGSAVPRAVYEEFLRSGAEGSDVVPPDRAAEALTQLVYAHAFREVLDAASIEITQDERNAFAAQLGKDDPFFTFSGALQTDLIYRQVGSQALTRVPAPSADELAERYADRPASVGLACYESVTVASRSEADEVVSQLRSGTPLADAGIAPDAEIGGSDGACVNLGTLWGTADHGVIEALIDARPGAPTAVETPSGWVVLNVLPYEAVSESIATGFAQGAGQFLAVGLLVTGDVTVDPAYGRWDAARGVVVTA